MMKAHRLSTLTGAVILALGLSTSAMANTTSSGVKGQITGPNGNPAAGTVVTITHVPSGSTKTAVVNDSGSFSSQGLRVGGPYKIVIDSDKYEDTELNNIFLTLGESFPVSVALESDNMEKIVVTGRVVNKNYGSNSPASNFNLKDLELAPSVSRDLKDVIRVDPRVYINESSNSAIVCAGGNPRFNSLTVDGARMNDNFGLNGNGYPTVRIPFSYDAIDQVAVELAPFDVQYGGFTSCNINAVTKSGGNEFEGSVFADYTSDSLKGDSLEGDDIDTGSYNEKRYGFNLGFPLIEDTLFFFAAYEKLDGAQIMQYSAFDNGAISQSEIDNIIQISKDNYNYDPGTMVPSIPVDDEKILVKLDWNINDQHRLNFVYNYNDGFEIGQSDEGSTRLSLSNHFYERGAEFSSYVSSLYSDWTDNFSTEVRVGYSKLDNRQISLDEASGFGEFRIERLGAASNVSVYLGPDDSRQSNELNYDTLSLKLAGTYYLDDHELYFGYEREELDVFNLFVQHSQTETRFNNIDDFENGLADDVYYGNANSLNPDDAAGEFSYALNTVYFQDKFDLESYDITITAGLRYDWYTSNDLPNYNPNFEARYGFSNSQNLDGIDLLQPRLGLNWTVDDQLEVRAGVGLYSGGNPNVWISNSYSNDGIRNIQDSSVRDSYILGPDAIAFDGTGQAGYDIPVQSIDAVTTGTADSSTNSTDPDFEIPSEWKYSLGLTYITESEYVITADYLFTDKQDSAIVTDLAAEQFGTAPDGRPLYDSARGFDNDFYLTNVDGDDGETTVVSFAVSKEYENGLSVTASYAYTNAKDVHPMTSSVAFSNYHGIATSDPTSPGVATSNYEIPHRFTLNVSYSKEFFDGLNTQFSLFGQAMQTHGYDYNFDNGSSGFGYNDSSRQLLYIPTESDSSVVYGADFDIDAFNNFITSEGLTRGEIIERNSLEGGWWTKFDIRVEQELPGFTADHKASAYLVIENFGNLLNDDWGVLKEGNFLQGAVEADITDSGQYSYNSFTSPSVSSRQTDSSLWEIRVGVKYTF
ncbi:TonB-dependent receptor [Pseudocolwellia sp. HL-MZ19]|uniref:TonB-dependent receptor n=1 Tax=Pseudocolwellia sp. HL-MZ19 TaxID=3400846 RepID=UPI003CE72CBB